MTLQANRQPIERYSIDYVWFDHVRIETVAECEKKLLGCGIKRDVVFSEHELYMLM